MLDENGREKERIDLQGLTAGKLSSCSRSVASSGNKGEQNTRLVLRASVHHFAPAARDTRSPIDTCTHDAKPRSAEHNGVRLC